MTSSPRDTNNQISCYPTKEKTHAVHTLPGDNREKPEAEAQRRERCSFPMAAAILSKAVSNKRRCPMNGQLLWLKCPGACRVSFHGVSLVIHTANTHQAPTNRPGGILSWQGGRKTPQTKPMIPVRFGITRSLERLQRRLVVKRAVVSVGLLKIEGEMPISIPIEHCTYTIFYLSCISYIHRICMNKLIPRDLEKKREESDIYNTLLRPPIYFFYIKENEYIHVRQAPPIRTSFSPFTTYTGNLTLPCNIL